MKPDKTKLKKPRVTVILGPTSSGKTAYSIKLAKQIKGEIISADSRQVYRGLDLGSGKVTKTEMAGIPHHLLDVVTPKKTFTIADFKRLADKKIKEIISRGHRPIIVGGTGFYIQAVVDDLVLPAVPPDKKLRTRLKDQTPKKLFAQLKKLDPQRAKSIDAQNPVRLIRAIEIARSLGQIPKLKKSVNPLYDFELIGLKVTPEKLNQKIRQRLNARLKQGLLAEIKRLHQSGVSWKRLEELGLESRYVARYLQGKLKKEEMFEQLYQAIVKYAKRQMTWFKRDKRIKWLEV